MTGHGQDDEDGEAPVEPAFSRWYLRRELRRTSRRWDGASAALDALDARDRAAASAVAGAAASSSGTGQVVPAARQYGGAGSSAAVTWTPPRLVETLRWPGSAAAVLILAWAIHPLVEALTDQTLPAFLVTAASLLAAAFLAMALVTAAVVALDVAPAAAALPPAARRLAWATLAALTLLAPVLAGFQGREAAQDNVLVTAALTAGLLATGGALVLLHVPGDRRPPAPPSPGLRIRVRLVMADGRRRIALRRARRAVRRYAISYAQAVERCTLRCQALENEGERERLLALLTRAEPRPLLTRSSAGLLPLAEPLERVVQGLAARDSLVLMPYLPDERAGAEPGSEDPPAETGAVPDASVARNQDVGAGEEADTGQQAGTGQDAGTGEVVGAGVT